MIHHHHPSPVNPDRVVVLGGSGFVGRYLLSHLKTLEIPVVSFTSGELDLCQPESVENLKQTLQPTDSLVVISALTPDRGRDIRTLMRNLSMIEHTCAALTEGACAQVVYISSDAVYADEANPVKETSCCDPSGFHGVMHLARERMLLQTTKAAKIPLLILRPSLLYGPGDTHNGYGPNRFLRTAEKDRKITLFGNGEEKRDHIYIEDVAQIIGLGLLHGSEGVLNVATGTAVSFFEAAQTIVDLWKGQAEVQIECLPRSNPITHRHFDITETYKAFPTFQYQSIASGLQKTFALIEKGNG
ncbi:MAG: NAD-dependent epimerase/dehydratase [Leptolyngbyaceae cyanobacterium bins.59]|nr:NAD-dependent epimerase/dehydratase [Leptolyngbyaceae cyanobacterium bins.59]